MLIWLNPEHFSEFNLTINDMNKIHRLPQERLDFCRCPTIKKKIFTGKMEERLSFVEDFENVTVKTTADGSNIYLRDAARIETDARSAVRPHAKKNTRARSAGLFVMQNSGYFIASLSSSNKPNSGALFVGLTTKELSITNIIQEVNKLGKKYPEATMPGLGKIGDRSMELLDMTGYSDEEPDDIA